MSGRPYDPVMSATYPDEFGYGTGFHDGEDICLRTQVKSPTPPYYPLDVLWNNGDANSYDWADPGKNAKDKY